jgi:hypothetical protein
MAITLGIDKPSFVVDSRDRGDGSIENFSYVISITENDTSGEFNQVAITSCTIPKSYYDLAVDSELRVDEDGDTRTITIPKGNYNVNSIQNVLLKLLNEPATLENDKPIYQMRYPDCRLDNDVGKFTWTVSYTNFTEWIDATAYVVGNRIIVDGVDDVLVFNVTYLCILNHTSTPLDKPEVGVNWETYWRVSEITWEIIGDNRLHDILGFDKDVSGTTIILFENNQLTSKNVINLEHTKYISIR